MTREEQIKKQVLDSTVGIASEYRGFIMGAEWADKKPNGSVIHWQKGEPKEGGTYLVTVISGNIIATDFTIGDTNDEHFFKEYVTAWCKLSDIEPYKEEANE